MAERVGAFIHTPEGQHCGWIALGSLGISESPQSPLHGFMMPIPLCLMVLLLTCFVFPSRWSPPWESFCLFFNYSLFILSAIRIDSQNRFDEWMEFVICRFLVFQWSLLWTNKQAPRLSPHCHLLLLLCTLWKYLLGFAWFDPSYSMCCLGFFILHVWTG